jgi:hypothetical protein
MPVHEEDDTNETREMLRMIICMSKQSSQRLLAAQYLQSDIAFKRVAGFLEFEIGGSDRNAKIGQFSFFSVCMSLNSLLSSSDLLSGIPQPSNSSCTPARFPTN